MRFYLASCFELVEEVENLASILESEGHEITQKWWLKDYKKLDLPDFEWYSDERVRVISERNFNAIEFCHIFVLVSSNTPRKFNGANIELGFAIALGKQVVSVGKLERSAMYVPLTQYPDIPSLMEHLRKWYRGRSKK